MRRTDSFEGVHVLFPILLCEYTPAPNVQVVHFDQLFTEVFALDRRIRLTLCPQGRCAFSTNCNVETLLRRCFHCCIDGERRERVGYVQREIVLMFDRGTNVQTM